MKRPTFSAMVLASCASICVTAVSTSAAAAVTYDLSKATVAISPAGTIADNVTDSSGSSSGYYGYGFKLVTDGWRYGGISNATILPATKSAVNGTLLAQFNQTFGVIDTGTTLTSGINKIPVINDVSVSTGLGRLYSDLVNPAQTSFSFTFTGTSVTAGNAVTATLSATDLNGQTFSQTATSNQQGNWSLNLTTPLGFKVDFFNLGIVGAGVNTLKSVAIGATIAVPEVGTLTMMSLGLMGLSLRLRRRQLK